MHLPVSSARAPSGVGGSTAAGGAATAAGKAGERRTAARVVLLRVALRHRLFERGQPEHKEDESRGEPHTLEILVSLRRKWRAAQAFAGGVGGRDGGKPKQGGAARGPGVRREVYWHRGARVARGGWGPQ